MSKHPPHSIERSELRVFPARPGQTTYQLHVGLPPGYAHGTGQTYPRTGAARCDPSVVLVSDESRLGRFSREQDWLLLPLGQISGLEHARL